MSYSSSACRTQQQGGCTSGRHQASSFGLYPDSGSGFLKFPHFINSCCAVSDETPNAVQNILLPLPSAVTPEVSAVFRKAFGGPSLFLCPHFGRGEAGWHCRHFRLTASRVWFRILSPSTDALCSQGEEEFPDEPMRVSGICCSRRGGVKGTVSPLSGKVMINPFYLLELVGFWLIL